MITGISGSEANPLHGSAGKPVLSPIASPSAPAPAPASAPEISAAFVNQQAALAAKVAEQPTVRADQVQRASELLASPSYPPRAILEAVAKLVTTSRFE